MAGWFSWKVKDDHIDVSVDVGAFLGDAARLLPRGTPLTGSFSIPRPPEWAPPALPGGGSSAPPTTSAEALAALTEIADAINAAESKLNVENFIIASGTVEAKLTLPAAGVTITFNIAPKPYA